MLDLILLFGSSALFYGGLGWALWKWASSPPQISQRSDDGSPTPIPNTPLFFLIEDGGITINYGHNTVIWGWKQLWLAPSTAHVDQTPHAITGYRLSRVMRGSAKFSAHQFTLSAILPDGSLITLLSRTTNSRFSFDALRDAMVAQGLLRDRDRRDQGSEADVPVAMDTLRKR